MVQGNRKKKCGAWRRSAESLKAVRSARGRLRWMVLLHSEAFDEAIVFLSYFTDVLTRGNAGKAMYRLDQVLLVCPFNGAGCRRSNH